MRYPLLPATALVALVILVCEGFFGLFSQWLDPARSQSHYCHYINDAAPKDGNDAQWMLVRVRELPSERNRSIRTIADVVAIEDSVGSPLSCHGKIMLYLQKPSSVALGDEILVFSTPKRPSASENPHQFDYRRHLQRKGILYTIYADSSRYRIVGHSGKGLMHRVTSLRKRMVNVIRYSRLTPSQQGIAEALFLGWDDDLDDDTEAHFQRAGITHLLCVSGLHVGIVALLVGYCLFFLGNKRSMRILKGCLQLVVIWLFVILTGMSPGTMRAGIMFSFIVVGQMFFTKPPTLNAIAASALILLVCNPLLLFNVGFQLSYSSVFGIVLFVRPLEELIPIPKVNKLTFVCLSKLRTLFCVSLVAQISTAPLILYYFHQFPLYFLVANMVVVPFAGLLLGSVLLLVVVAWWPWAFSVAGAVVSAELTATEWVTSNIASWPHSMLQNIYFDGFMLLFAFAIIAALGAALLCREWRWIVMALACTLPLSIHARHIESACSTQRHFDIYRVGNRTAIEFFVGHKSYLLCDSNVAKNPQSIAFQTDNNLLWRKARRCHILSLDTSFEDENLFVDKRFIAFDGKTMRIIDRSNYREMPHQRLKIDYLIIRESPYITAEELKNRYDFDTLVVTSQNSRRRSRAWIEQCDSLGIPLKQ